MALQIPTLIFLAILGLLITLYLIYTRLSTATLVCPIGKECHNVLQSKYNSIFKINNDILGLTYYIFIIFEILIYTYFSKNILLIMQITSGIALSFSIYLFYVQAKILRKYCFYCIVSSIINLLMFITIIML